MVQATRAEWLAQRRTGIGGSDAPVVTNVSPYKSRYALWAEKIGMITDAEETEPMEFGRKLESVVLSTLSERTGREVEPWPQTEIVRHEDHKFAICTPDAFQLDTERGRGIVQAKTCSAFLADEWRNDPPLSCQVQIQHEMMVTGTDWGTLCVLKGGNSFAWFDVDRNDSFIDSLVESERAFWDLVLTQTPPDVDNSVSCSRALAKLHPDDSGEQVLLPDEAVSWDEDLQKVKHQIKKLVAEEKLLKNRIVGAIGDATYGLLPDGSQYTLKSQTRMAYEVAEATFRVLRRQQRSSK